MLSTFAQQSDSNSMGIRRDQTKLWSWPRGEPWQWSLAELGVHRGLARGQEHLPPWSKLLCLMGNACVPLHLTWSSQGLVSSSQSQSPSQTILCNTKMAIHCPQGSGRVAEVAREQGWHPPKSLDSDKNFKPEQTLFCGELRFVAIYALFGDLRAKKVPFWV